MFFFYHSEHYRSNEISIGTCSNVKYFFEIAADLLNGSEHMRKLTKSNHFQGIIRALENVGNELPDEEHARSSQKQIHA